MLTARDYRRGDYATICSWWGGHEVSEVPQEVLPALGLVVERDGLPIAAGWLYLDNSTPICWLAWVVVEPGQTPRQVNDALVYLLGAMETCATAHGRKVMVTACQSASLARWFKRRGFIDNHGGVHDLIKTLH